MDDLISRIISISVGALILGSAWGDCASKPPNEPVIYCAAKRN